MTTINPTLTNLSSQQKLQLIEKLRQQKENLAAAGAVMFIRRRQGPWNVDLRTPPGPEGSNGSLLCVCRGHPGI